MKRLLLLILSLMMLLPAISGCKGHSATPGSKSTDDRTAAGSYKADYLPDSDFDGYLFRLVDCEADITHFDEDSADAMHSEMYRRDALLESRYNFEFTSKTVASYDLMTTEFYTNAMSQSDNFDLCKLIMRDAFLMATEGYVTPAEALPYCDITQDWYIHDVNEQLSINNRLWFAYSDECTGAYLGTLMIFFNKTIADDLKLGNLYDMVDNGTWTVDRFYDFAAKAKQDINEDGYSINNGEDRFGVICENDTFLASIWIGSGELTVRKDSDDFPYFAALGNEKLYGIVEKLFDFYHSDGNVYDGFRDDKVAVETYTKDIGLFANGRALFMPSGLVNMSSLGSMNDDFGMLPLPKYNEEQENYYSRLMDGWINTVPSSNTDLSRTSIIMESMAVETKNLVYPAYLNSAMENKYLRDDESRKMIDLAQERRIVDLGDTVWMVPVRTTMLAIFNKNTCQVDSTISSMKDVINETIRKGTEGLDY